MEFEVDYTRYIASGSIACYAVTMARYVEYKYGVGVIVCRHQCTTCIN